MVRATFGKRKLEQESADQTTTPKRLKPSKGGDSAKKDGTTANGDAVATPSNAVKANLSNNGQPSSSKSQKKAGKNQSTGQNATDEAAQIATPTSNGKSRKEKKRQSVQGADDASARGQGETPVPKPKQPNAIDGGIVNGTPSTSKKSKKHKRQSQEQDSLALTKIGDRDTETGASWMQENLANATQQVETVKEVRRPAQEAGTRSREDDSLSTPNQHGWWLSAPSAGRFLDHDPVFVQDDNGDGCLITATGRSIRLLSLETSLVIRSHTASDNRLITSYCKSTSDPQCVDVAYEDGTKVQWNWISGEVVEGTFPAQETVIAMDTAPLADGSSELFYITEKDESFSVVAGRNATYSTERRLTGIQVLYQGAYIICTCATAIVIGAREKPEAQSNYIWTEIPVEVPIRCLDARLIYKLHSKRQTERPELALALGNAEGQIHLYTNIASLVTGKGSQAQFPHPRILHWHREPVSSVKFSKDGNYLISGGKETVLVIWQLETGKRQYLPHLTAEIERIVVSPGGAQYALQMGDNSIMVLGTSELKAVANFAGLQLPHLTNDLISLGVDLPKATAVLHPQDPYRLLLSVPSTQPKTAKDITTRPFLQAFDIRHSRHLLRQALTRNNVTDLGLGPEQTPITPPDASQLAASADGKWLATVDEWFPPAVDLEHQLARRSGLDADDLKEVAALQESKREVYLKFWRWNEDQQMWTLSTRADAPHALSTNTLPSPGAGRVLKLVADPSGNSFATIGEDSVVKIWRPRTRTRHGVPLQEADGTDAVDWVCKRSIPLHTSARVPERADSPMEEVEEQPFPQPIVDACLAFSPDGSMLACGQVTLDDNALPSVHFISPETGSITASKAGLVAPEQELIDVAFVDRFFISLSVGSVRVWNLVDDSHVYTIALNEAREEQGDAMLAVNHTDDTFALISYVDPQDAGPARPKLEIYHPKKPECLFAATFTTMPAALLAGNGTRGFTILFEDGTIRTASSTASPSGLTTLSIKKEEPLALPSAETLATIGQQQDQEVETLALPAGEYTRAAADVVVEDDRRVVRPEQLALISDVGLNSSMPALTEMFQNIVGLYGRKPREAVGVEREGMEM